MASTDSFIAVGFKDGVNSGKFVLRCSLTGTYTDVDLGITPAINTIYKISETYNPLSSPAGSIDRLEIKYNKSESVLISPKDKNAFINDLILVNPNIEVQYRRDKKQQ